MKNKRQHKNKIFIPRKQNYYIERKVKMADAVKKPYPGGQRFFFSTPAHQIPPFLLQSSHIFSLLTKINPKNPTK